MEHKNPNLEELQKLCRDHKPFLDELIDNLKEKNETIRYNSARILTRIAEEEPDKIYPYWRVGKARPEYVPRIKDILFSIDGLNQEHKGLLKGDALLAFTELWDLLNPATKKKVIILPKDCLTARVPKPRRRLRSF